MMLKTNYNEKITQLKALKKGSSPEEQLEIDFIIFGMQRAFGDNPDDLLHDKRMELLYSNNQNDKRKGESYRKGMDIVLYSIQGKKKEPGTVQLPCLRVEERIESALNKIKDYLGVRTTATIRKAALRWYIETMNEKYGKDFFK